MQSKACVPTRGIDVSCTRRKQKNPCKPIERY
nr:MAG TPA: hypothetical protein [Caudoviricetes sp.]